ncbi:MAG: alkaline phosphatase family protein [Deltaproteobacteria bacterium]|nr:alkaline phosphatase family protein [Deltaproteobacteria bacterium]
MKTAGKRRKIMVAMMDGFGPDYLQASDMPNLKLMIKEGFYKTVNACMPTVTNINNASICTGEYPEVHGITANSYFDLATREEHYMDRAELLLAPTIFEKAQAAGMKSALLTAKAKTIRMLNRGAHIFEAAEQPSREWVNKLGPPADIYSAEINYWLWKAVLVLLKEQPDIDLFYCHTTDYTMHMSDPMGEVSQMHLHEIDKFFGRILDACPHMEFYLTADHGMNAKRRCYDLNRYMSEKGLPIFFVMFTERDPYIQHHRTFGGTAFVWLNRVADYAAAVDILRRIEGVEAVYNKYEAAATFHLHPDRIGDLIVVGDKDTVFGPLDGSAEDLPQGFRAHGSAYEAPVPLVVYNSDIDCLQWDAYLSNCHLTAHIQF